MAEVKNQVGGGETTYSEGINALRAFACMAIVAWHVLANGDFRIDGYFVTNVIPSWNDLVYLFMIISGFGMCNGYYKRLKDRKISIEDFYSRRYTKVLPFFALLILADMVLEHSLESVYEGFIELTLVFGFLPNNELSVIGVAWTLGVIFAFYIIFPFVMYLIWNKTRAWGTLLVSLAIHALCKVYFMTDKFVVFGYSLKHNFLFCMPYFIVGCLIYLYKDTIINVIRKYEFLSLLVCSATTIFYYFVSYRTNSFWIIDIVTMILHAVWVGYGVGTTNRLFCNQVTRYIGGISMEIYLAHMMVFRALEKMGVLSLLGNGAVAYLLVVAVILAVLVISVPILQSMLDVCLGRITAVVEWLKFRREK